MTANLVFLSCVFFLLWLFVPQVFYVYYRLTISGLEQQWVTRSFDQIAVFADALALEPGLSLAATSTGLCFWLLVAMTLGVHISAWRHRRPAA